MILVKWLPKYKCVLFHIWFLCTWKMADLKATDFVLNWAKLYKNFQNMESSFWREDKWEEHKPWVVCWVQKHCVFCWICWEMEINISEQIAENVDYVKEFILINERITICEVTNMLGISLGLVQRTMKDKWSQKWDSGFGFL